MRNNTKQPEVKKAVTSTDLTPAAVENMPELNVNPVIKAKAEIQASYSAHLEAQNVFEEAFEKMAQLDEMAMREAEKRFRAYKVAVENSFIKREEAEGVALETYRKTLIKANFIYRDAMLQALRDCQQNTLKASQQLTGITLTDYRVDRPGNPDYLPRIKDNVGHGYLVVKNWLNRTFRQMKSRFAQDN